MINIKHTLEEVARGNFTRKVFLRKNDFLKEEAAILNHMVDQLAGRYEDIREDTTVLLAMIEVKLDENTDGIDIKPILNKVKANAVHTRNILDKVKIDPDKSHVN